MHVYEKEKCGQCGDGENVGKAYWDGGSCGWELRATVGAKRN